MLDLARGVTPLCWMAKLREVCFVHLGKFGDLMIMLPAFKAVADELGHPPICLVSTEFASIFDGVSYVKPWAFALHWWKGVGQARKAAEGYGLSPIVVKWWDEPGAKPPGTINGSETIKLTIHGNPVRIAASEWDSYQASQWRYAGFTMQQMIDWPLVFDRRDLQRESLLRAAHFKTSFPKLLVNLPRGGTSPFPSALQAYGFISRKDFEVVNLSNVRATRIYDLLGLYDHAAGLITSDTATLHLAAASKVPYIAFINDGGAGSIPKGNCICSIRYKDFQKKLGLYMDALRCLRT